MTQASTLETVSKWVPWTTEKQGRFAVAVAEQDLIATVPTVSEWGPEAFVHLAPLLLCPDPFAAKWFYSS